MIRPEDIVVEARRWIGVPFAHQGRSRYGVDCVGLVICVRSACGPFPEVDDRPATYSRTARDESMLKHLQAVCREADRAEPGGVVLIQWPGTQSPSHVALCCGDTIVHAYMRQRKVLEVGYRAQWTRWTHSWWRLPGVGYV